MNVLVFIGVTVFDGVYVEVSVGVDVLVFVGVTVLDGVKV